MIRRWAARAASVIRSNDGVVAIQMALTLTALLGMAGLATDVGLILYKQRQMQVAADAAAYSAAVANATGHPSDYTMEAYGVAGQNGFVNGSNNITVTPSLTGNSVTVIISQPQSPILAGVVHPGSFTVSAQAVADSSTTVSSCILALSTSGTGVSLSGGTSITAPTCAVASQASVSVPSGTHITAKEVDYNGSTPVYPGGITGPGGIPGTIKKVSTPDPLAGNAGVAAANAELTVAGSVLSPSNPSAPAGTNVTFSYTQYPPALPSGCTATGSPYSANWTVTCAAGGTYNFGSMTVAGTATFAQSATATYNFSGTVTNNGTLKFGPGTFTMSQGLVTGGGTTTNFGAGTFNIGAGPSCSGPTYSICQGGGSSLTFGGPSTFVLSSGISNGGSSTISFGAGTTNSYKIGAPSSGYALNNTGPAITFADATGSNSVFQVYGDLLQAGGTCLTLPAAANHDINGSLLSGGGITLGSGLYAIGGKFWMGAITGGDVSCTVNGVGNPVGVSASNVTIALAGNSPKSGTTSSKAGSNNLFVGAGFGHVTISAPTFGTYANIAIVGPLSTAATGGALLTDGALQTTVQGALYFPNGPLELGGAANIGNANGQCLQIVATEVTLTGGTTAASTCFSAPGATGTPRLIE